MRDATLFTPARKGLSNRMRYLLRDRIVSSEGAEGDEKKVPEVWMRKGYSQVRELVAVFRACLETCHVPLIFCVQPFTNASCLYSGVLMSGEQRRCISIEFDKIQAQAAHTIEGKQFHGAFLPLV